MNKNVVDQWVKDCVDRLEKGLLFAAIVSPDRAEITSAISAVESLGKSVASSNLIVCDCSISDEMLRERYFADAFFGKVVDSVLSQCKMDNCHLPPVGNYLRFKLLSAKLFNKTGKRCLLVCPNFSECLKASGERAVNDICGLFVSIADAGHKDSDCKDRMNVSYLLGATIPIRDVETHRCCRGESGKFAESTLRSRVRDCLIGEMA